MHQGPVGPGVDLNLLKDSPSPLACLQLYSADLQTHSADLQTHSTDLQPHSADLQPHSTDLQPHSADLQPHSAEFRYAQVPTLWLPDLLLKVGTDM